MRNFWRVLCISFAFLFLFCACSLQMQRKEIKIPPLSFCAEAQVTHREKIYRVRLTVPNTQSFEVYFLEPKPLNSLEIIQTPSECVIRFLDLEVKKESPFIPQTSFATLLWSAFASLQNAQNYICEKGKEVTYYIGKTPAGTQFTFTVDSKTGIYKALSMPSEKLEVQFSNFNLL